MTSFSQSLGPFRATATPFMPKTIESACLPKQYIPRKQTLQGGRVSATLAPLFFDPSRLLRKALVYRHFYNRKFACSTVGELADSQIFKSVQKPNFWDWYFLVYCQNNICSEQCIFARHFPTSIFREILFEETCRFYSFGHEWGRRGSEWAETLGK